MDKPLNSPICDALSAPPKISPPLPPNTRPLSHQVAGHRHGADKDASVPGFLETDDDCILKPLQAPPRGTRELNFYERVFNPSVTDPITLQLRPLLPDYLGPFTSPAVPDLTYIRMRDVARQFKNPCIADIKMGRITYDPDATPEKILKETTKYPPLTNIGFQIRGIRVYYPSTGRDVLYDKDYLRSLDEETVLTKGLAVFYNKEHGLRRDAITSILERLEQIRQWFSEQKVWNFYASSLLIVYEGDPPESNGFCNPTHNDNLNTISDLSISNGKTLSNPPSTSNALRNCTTSTTSTSENGDVLKSHLPSTASSCHCVTSQSHTQRHCPHGSQKKLVDIRMIDFAHVFEADGKDENYMFGLQKLIRYHEKLLNTTT